MFIMSNIKQGAEKDISKLLFYKNIEAKIPPNIITTEERIEVEIIPSMIFQDINNIYNIINNMPGVLMLKCF